jgi:hypothetical protein
VDFFLAGLSPNNSGDNKSRGEIEVITHLHPKEGVWENQKGVIFHHSRSSSCSHPVSLHLLLSLSREKAIFFMSRKTGQFEILTAGWIFGDYSTRPIRPLNHASCQPSAPTIRRGHGENVVDDRLGNGWTGQRILYIYIYALTIRWTNGILAESSMDCDI